MDQERKAREMALGLADREQDGEELLTADERLVIRLAGELATLVTDRVIGHGDEQIRREDIAEMEAAIHVVQRMVAAQAAARAYPGKFRLLGEALLAPDGQGE